MKESTTTIVNGQAYDKTTGLPITAGKEPAPKTATSTDGVKRRPATAGQPKPIHPRTQRSKTLRRSSVKKPVGAAEARRATKPTDGIIPRKKPTTVPAISQHPDIKKHLSHNPAPTKEVADIAPRTHPHVVAANQRILHKKNSAAQPAPIAPTPKQAKDAAITKALSAAQPKTTKKSAQTKKAGRKKALRLTTIIVAALVVIGILAWLYLPLLSVKMAASHTGVPAALPQFTPEGYSLSLPVETKDNAVALTFNGPQKDTVFTLTQSKSSWDSDAVRSMVEKKSKGQFLTTRDRGLTIYTYNGNGAWVNKGVLYVIASTTPLPNDTILRIASSL